MSQLEKKIEANDRTVQQVLDNKKYTVDYFQREYRWEDKHIEQLISDLTLAFFEDFEINHQRRQVANYNSYYLGPFVVSIKDGQRSIIDGQQRLTSLTLLLIYLNNLQKQLGLHETLESMIFSESFGEKSFNIDVEERRTCLEGLFYQGEYMPEKDDDESTQNMAARYQDISNNFPEELKSDRLPFFMDWLKHRVVLVEIVAYSDDNAYIIFETMNDRGLNLTPTEMLKGYLLSRFDDTKKRQKANDFWKREMLSLQEFDKDEDQRFLQAWLRAQYADTIRPGKAGSKNEDFEKIGTRFHSWVRENLKKLGIDENRPEDFEDLLFRSLKFFLNAYKAIRTAEKKEDPFLTHVLFIREWGIAQSMSYPLMLSVLCETDTDEIVYAKINEIAKYIDSFCVKRSVNYRLFNASSIRYTMYSLVKEIRRKSLEEIKKTLESKLAEMPENLDGILDFGMHGQNRYFIKYLLARITSFIEQKAGIHSSFEKYMKKSNGKPYEVEHIWADKFGEHLDEFEQQNDFADFRNRLGGLLLLQRGTNQSFNALPYEQKVQHYIKENLLAASLVSETYERNPNFLNMISSLSLPFQAHSNFKKDDFVKRQSLYYEIGKLIWGS